MTTSIVLPSTTMVAPYVAADLKHRAERLLRTGCSDRLIPIAMMPMEIEGQRVYVLFSSYTDDDGRSFDDPRPEALQPLNQVRATVERMFNECDPGDRNFETFPELWDQVAVMRL